MSTETATEGTIFQDWMADIGALLDQAEDWARQEGWPVRRESVRIAEQPFGEYQAPALVMESPWGEVWLEPVARNVMGARGRVDLMAYPSANRVMLMRSLDSPGWRIRTDNLFLRESWNNESLLWLSRALHHA